MNVEEYTAIGDQIIALGYYDDIDWSENACPPECASDFALEAIFVVGHKGKVSAIKRIWEHRQMFFEDYMSAEDKIAFCETLPWIGPITKFHLAKNFGVDCAKPDRHLQRVADKADKSVDDLCRELAEVTGDKIRTVDLVIWRAAERGII